VAATGLTAGVLLLVLPLISEQATSSVALAINPMTAARTRFTGLPFVMRHLVGDVMGKVKTAGTATDPDIRAARSTHSSRSYRLPAATPRRPRRKNPATTTMAPTTVIGIDHARLLDSADSQRAT
jgi:hypothetical protein